MSQYFCEKSLSKIICCGQVAPYTKQGFFYKKYIDFMMNIHELLTTVNY